MTSTTITIDQQHANKVEAVARASKLSVEEVVARAIDHYVAYAEDVRAEIVEAKADVEAGRLMSLDDLRKRVAGRRRQQRTAR